ncbi:hypothetical protein RB2654_00405 [Rhodobacterales bacterium HTCC2654]|uniref:Uncharacterized protein n=1 Tax=Maritimibacter alkaliphilus HTCC2654 TaxID=314271 RepID=A3VIV7_9RHOB|nr:hypothetical protein RB2654_00405 [Rhodobacterales bacterium HTCC2654] [Maritimibacter alkaliphilus HTCC2654]
MKLKRPSGSKVTSGRWDADTAQSSFFLIIFEVSNHYSKGLAQCFLFGTTQASDGGVIHFVCQRLQELPQLPTFFREESMLTTTVPSHIAAFNISKLFHSAECSMRSRLCQMCSFA